MSQAEYFSKPFPFVAKLASMLRNNAAVQFVVARFTGLLRGNKGGDEPLTSPFLGEIPGVEQIPRPGELPGHGETPGPGEISCPDETPDPGAMPGAEDVELPPLATAVSDEATAAVRSDQTEREKLIRRRWAETGIKMWNANATLTIQGRADLLPAKPGATRREYDRLEFKLMAGQIVCEGVVVDPPTRRN